MTEFHALSARIAAATTCEDLFGVLSGTLGERLRALATAYRHIVREVHPDLRPFADAKVANLALGRATALRNAAEEKLRAGTYGDRSAPSGPSVITTPRRSYRVGSFVARGDACDLHACSYDESSGLAGNAVLKIARRSADGDLLENEAKVLRRLWPAPAPEEKFLRYLPRLIDSFLVAEGLPGEARRVNALAAFPSHVSLERVKEVHAEGLDFRDVAWMAKRLFAALGFLHENGIVHGAVILPHVLVHPIDHGARLVDYCYAVESGATVSAISSPYRVSYAPEILRREPTTPQTDIFMAARCAQALLARDTPAPVTRFFATCTAARVTRRPSDAWALHEELDELLRRLVGRPTYRPLHMGT